MAFQIGNLACDFASGRGNVYINEQPAQPSNDLKEVTLWFGMKPAAGSTDAVIEAGLKAKAKAILLAAAAIL